MTIAGILEFRRTRTDLPPSIRGRSFAFSAGVVLLIIIWGMRSGNPNVDVSGQVECVNNCVRVIELYDRMYVVPTNNYQKTAAMLKAVKYWFPVNNEPLDEDCL